MKFNIQQDFDIKKLLNNLNLGLWDMKYLAEAKTVFFFFANQSISLLSIYMYRESAI
jgi:hypothetical protein